MFWKHHLFLGSKSGGLETAPQWSCSALWNHPLLSFFAPHPPPYPPHSLMCDRIWLVLSFVPNRTWFPRAVFSPRALAEKKIFLEGGGVFWTKTEKGVVCLQQVRYLHQFEPKLHCVKCFLHGDVIVFISQASLFLLHQCVLNANMIPYTQLFALWAYYISNTCMVHYCAVGKDSQGCEASLGGWLSERVKAGAFLCGESLE